MATARIIRDEDDNLTPLVISIPSSGAISPATYIIANGQPVTFTNGSTSVVNVTFAPDAFGVTVFNNVSGLNPGASVQQTPQTNDRTVNFNTDGSANYPYAIQVGAGPIFVKVTGSVCTPDPVIPVGGTVEFIATDQNYTVTWNASNGDPFNPPLTKIYLSGNPLTKPHTAYLPVGNYAYTITAGGITEGNGGGTVKVKNT
jgi:plastocyanin